MHAALTASFTIGHSKVRGVDSRHNAAGTDMNKTFQTVKVSLTYFRDMTSQAQKKIRRSYVSRKTCRLLIILQRKRTRWLTLNRRFCERSAPPPNLKTKAFNLSSAQMINFQFVGWWSVLKRCSKNFTYPSLKLIAALGMLKTILFRSVASAVSAWK